MEEYRLFLQEHQAEKHEVQKLYMNNIEKINSYLNQEVEIKIFGIDIITLIIFVYGITLLILPFIISSSLFHPFAIPFLLFSSYFFGLRGGLIAFIMSSTMIIISMLFLNSDANLIMLTASIGAFFIIGVGLGTGIDIYEKQRSKLKKQNDLLNGILDSISDIIAIQNPDYRIERYNQTGYEVLNKSPEEVRGKKCYQLLGRDEKCEACATQKALKTKKLETVEKYFPELEAYLNCRSNPVLDDNGNVLYIVEHMRDVTQRKEQEQKIRYMNYHDRLTGLYNRNYLIEEMQRLDSNRQLPLSIVMGDVNGLKLVNDSLGHNMGDNFLKETAEVVKKCCRREDIIVRWGGDEIVILLPQTSSDKADEIIKRIKEECSKVKIEGIPLSIAFGHATKTDSEQSLDHILQKADENMYKNKFAESKKVHKNIVDSISEKLKKSDKKKEKHLTMLEKLYQRT